MSELKPLQKVLVANRGEIARRVIRTAKAMGLRTVAVHSDVDAGLPFVLEADSAELLGPADVNASYRNTDAVLQAALRSGAAAIHPGYGFLSENAGFAQAVVDAGLIWIGPSPAAITAMGDKIAARNAMQAAGVPVAAFDVTGPRDILGGASGTVGAVGPDLRVAALAALGADRQACRAHAAAALQCGSAADVRSLAREFTA